MSNDLNGLAQTPSGWSPAPITRDLALQFALILSSGVPHLSAMGYMRPDLDTHPLKLELDRWLKDPNVQAAILKVQGKDWSAMSLTERITFSIDKNYTEMAYFLYSHNYCELVGPDKTKADTCRQALEAKLAGLAGKMNALSDFWSDIQAGRLVLDVKGSSKTSQDVGKTLSDSKH